MSIDPGKMAAFTGDVERNRGGSGPLPLANFDEFAAGKYSELIPFLEDYSGDIEDSADLLPINPQDVFDDIPQQEVVVTALKEDFGNLSVELKERLILLTDSTVDDVRVMARHLAEQGMVSDADQVAAWLRMVALTIFGGKLPEEKDSKVA